MRLRLTLIIWLGLSFTVAAQTAKVTHVSDGDSFILASGERVRMIGINAPELADLFGPEAKEYLAGLVRNKTVTLERDPENDDRDIHGRLLRYVTSDGTDINHKMIADGYAYAFLRYPFSRERRAAYRKAEADAKKAQIGIWSTEPKPTRVGIDPPADDSILASKGKWIAAAAVLIVLLLTIAFAVRR